MKSFTRFPCQMDGIQALLAQDRRPWFAPPAWIIRERFAADGKVGERLA
jgi:hypothetical protein